MVTVRESKFIKFEEGISVELMDIDVGSASELPQADFIEGKLLYQGSIAHDISTGDFYCIDSEGTWYNQDGSGAYVPDEPEDDPDSNVGEMIMQSDIPVEFTDTVESEGTGETAEEVLGNELNVLVNEESSPEELDEEESEDDNAEFAQDTESR